MAEQSGFKATARHGDVVALCKELARNIQTRSTASSDSRPREGPLPLLILADPPVRNAEEAARDAG